MGWNSGSEIGVTAPVPVSGTVTADQGAAGATPWPVILSGAGSPSDANHDAFSRQRVSLPVPLSVGVFNFVNGGGNQLLALRYTGRATGGGGRAAQTNQASVLLSTAGAAGDAYEHQTKEYFQYRGGLGHLIFCTFVLVKTEGTNCIRRVGYFDENDGIFLQRDADGTIRMTIRTATSGAPSDANTQVRSAWYDPMNGLGASGVNLDFTKRQILAVDLQFLGVGLVRVFFDVNGQLYLAATFANANEGVAGDGVYMRQASLPVRWEIVQSAPGTPGSLEAICQAVHREGSEVEPAVHTHAFSEGLVTVSTTWTVIVAVRLKTNALRAALREFTHAVLNTDNTLNCETGIILNPTFSGLMTFGNITAQGNEISEFHDGSVIGRTITNPTPGGGGAGMWLSHGYAPAGNRGGSGQESTEQVDLPCVADITGTRDVVALVARSQSGTPQVRGSLGYRELY